LPRGFKLGAAARCLNALLKGLQISELLAPMTFGSRLPHIFQSCCFSHSDEAGTRDAMAQLLVFSGD
jgi:hypothetical protein